MVSNTRLLQGKFLIFLTPNWYQNAKYDFSSFEGRRWAAHSGTDSDDLLVYSGIIGKKKNIIIGLNYERHGVTYKFPPEVKFRLKINMGLRLKTYTYLLIMR